MTSDSPSSPDGDEPRLTWRERELLAALRRLANARAQLQTLEDEQSRHPVAPTLDRADVDQVESLETESAKLRERLNHRFGRSAARDRLAEVEMQQRLVLERLGFDSYTEFAARETRPQKAPDAVDPALVEFARHEVEAAADAYAQVLALPVELDDGDTTIDSRRAVASVPDVPRTIDLTTRDAR
jgi:hypothetical protein